MSSITSDITGSKLTFREFARPRVPAEIRIAVRMEEINIYSWIDKKLFGTHSAVGDLDDTHQFPVSRKFLGLIPQ